MAFTWWRFRTRRFSVDGLKFVVRNFAASDGLHSALSMLDVEQVRDCTPLVGPDAVRNHRLHCTLPDGRMLDVELGYITSLTTGIVARVDGQVVHESHPGVAPAYPEKYRADTVKHASMKDTFQSAHGDQSSALSSGVFAKNNRLPFAIDIITGLLFYVIAKMTDLQTAAMVGVAVGFALVLFQYVTKIDVTGGLALFGIVMLAISAGLAWYLADDEWVKLRGTITGLIGASFFIIDGLRGGHYVGRGLARYMPYSDIDPGRMAFSMGLVGIVMAALNYVVAKIASTDMWLFYKTFVDFFIVAALAMVAVRYARKAA